MTDWKDDKSWSDGLLTSVKQILGLYLIGEAKQDDDQQRNTDLIVLKMEAVRIACRIRRNDYFKGEYKGEFTIRSSRPNGTKTELTKIIEGWGDYFFYGFANTDGMTLSGYTLTDLKCFRIFHSRYLALNQGRCPGRLFKNKDGSSSFTVFKWVDMPEEMIVAQQGLGL